MSVISAPLSQTQTGIFTECMQHPDGKLYLIAFLYKLHPDTDPGRLEDALRQTVKAHPSILMRMRVNEEGVPEQWLDTEAVPDIATIRADSIDGIRKHLVQPMPMTEGPLALFRFILTPECNYFLLQVHHAISDGTSPNGTYTKAGFVYDADKLTPIGKLQEINAKVSNRKKMICFEEKETGERFIFSVNHFKAKSGSGSGGDANQGDGQGTFNATRVEEAQAVIDHYKKYRQALGEQDILIMGDLNAYAKEDPITRLTSNGMLDLHRAFHADSSYSYQFGGLAGYLDHALSNGSLYPQVTGVSGFHINSDENDRYTYDKSDDYTMFRCSDHDPVIVGLRLDGTKVYDPSPAINSAEIISGEAGVMTITNAISETPSYYAIYDMSGVLIEQKEIVSTMQEVELPGKAGVYIVYIYFDGQVYQRKMIVR